MILENKGYQEKYHIFSAQTIRITLFVYVYVRLFAPGTCVLDIFLNPLFFFLDGMAFRIEEDETFLHFLYRKFRTFIVPYFFLAILLVLLDTALLPVEGINPSLEYLKDSFLHIFIDSRVYSLWYLPSLFFAETIVYLTYRLSKKRLSIQFLMMTMVLVLSLVYNHYLHIFLPLSMDTAFIGSFYLFLGYLLMHEKTAKIRPRLFRNRGFSFLMALILLTISTLSALYIYSKYKTCFSGSKALYSPYHLILPISLVGTMGIIYLAYAVRNPVFHEVGQMTMIILALEEEVWIKLYRNLIAKNWYLTFENNNHLWNIEEITCCFLGALLAVLLSIPFYYLFMKTPLCVIFNRKPKKKDKEKNTLLTKLPE